MADRNASSANRWAKCPGSIELVKQAPPFEGNKYTREGTQAHDVAEAVITGKKPKKDATPEMLQGAELWKEHVASIREQSPWMERVEVKYRSKRVPELSGKMDYLAAVGTTLYASDYKFGAGKAVFAESNEQLLSYFVLADEYFFGVFENFIGSIVQPRSFDDPGIKTHTYTLEEVLDFKSAILADVGSDRLKLGDHCNWCPALSICPAARQQAKRLAELAFTEPELSDEELLELYESAGAIKKFLGSLDGEIIGRINRGSKSFPDLKVVESEGHRKWTDEPEVIARKLGVDLSVISELAILTPAKVEKVLKIKLDPTLTHKPSLGEKLRSVNTKGKRAPTTAEVFADE